MENVFYFSELSLKAFETGKRFNAKENEKFAKMALQSLKEKLIKKGLENGEN